MRIFQRVSRNRAVVLRSSFSVRAFRQIHDSAGKVVVPGYQNAKANDFPPLRTSGQRLKQTPHSEKPSSENPASRGVKHDYNIEASWITVQLKKLNGTELDRFFNDICTMRRANVFHFNTMISKKKSLESASNLLTRMKDMGIELDTVTYNCLIDLEVCNAILNASAYCAERLQGWMTWVYLAV